MKRVLKRRVRNKEKEIFIVGYFVEFIAGLGIGIILGLSDKLPAIVISFTLLTFGLSIYVAVTSKALYEVKK